jgi:hypothetical protein
MHYEEIDAKGQRILTRTENFVNHHQGFEQVLKSPALVGLLEQLTGEKMILFKEKINYKVCHCIIQRNIVTTVLNLNQQSPAGGGFAPHVCKIGHFISLLMPPVQDRRSCMCECHSFRVSLLA